MATEQTLRCSYCGGAAALHEDSSQFYRGTDYGPIWACAPCQAWVGCHPGTFIPLGRLANESLRKMKSRAHAAFDPIWKEGSMSRKRAYRWLGDQLGTDPSETHIGMFNEDQCHLAEAVAMRWRDEGHARPKQRHTKGN